MQFTDDEFKCQHRRMAAQARENFLRDGRLTAAMLVYARDYDRPFPFVQASPDMTNAEHQEYADAGLVPVPGHFRMHEDRLASMIAEVGGFAATVVMETWLVTGSAAQESLKHELRPAQHPMRDEGLVFFSAWPERGLTHFNMDRIDRGKTERTLRLERFGQDVVDELDGATIAGWLLNVLPGGTVPE